LLPDRTTAVHYLKFTLAPEDIAGWLATAATAGPHQERIAFVVRHAQLNVRTPLPLEVVRALAEDLTEGD
jgi:hypothetical protein